MGDQPNRDEALDPGEARARPRYPDSLPPTRVILAPFVKYTQLRVVVYHQDKGAYQFSECTRWYLDGSPTQGMIEAYKKMMTKKIVHRMQEADMLFGWHVGPLVVDEYEDTVDIMHPQETEPIKLL